MARRRSTVRFVPDGTFSFEDIRERLATSGEFLETDEGEAKFVPDDPTYPTTYFRSDGLIELDTAAADDVRLERYVGELCAWLGLRLQRVG